MPASQAAGLAPARHYELGRPLTLRAGETSYVPLTTLTGWQFRSARIGSPSTLIAMAGAYIQLPKTRADRERTGDPRPSIEERYGTKDVYLRKVREAAQALATARFILAEDVQPIVEECGAQWEALLASR